MPERITITIGEHQGREASPVTPVASAAGGEAELELELPAWSFTTAIIKRG